MAKLLKKYDTKTGRLRCLPFIQKVLEHPFLTTDLISKLVRECESIIDEAFQGDEAVLDGKEFFKNTVEALLTTQEDAIVVEEGEASKPNSGVSLNTRIARM